MTLDFSIALAALITAHLLADFPLQTDAMVRRKREWRILVLHAGVVGGLSYLFMTRWDDWTTPLIITVSHALIDAVKARVPASGGLGAFLIDQAAHLLVILVFLSYLRPPPGSHFGLFAPTYLQGLILLSGAVLTIWTSGVVVGFAVEPYREKLRSRADDPVAVGLEGAGKRIGQLERTLIFASYLAGAPGSLGFLIAAKSIFRFGDIGDSRNRQAAEYIIIGTLMSFAFAAVLTLGTTELMEIVFRTWPPP